MAASHDLNPSSPLSDADPISAKRVFDEQSLRVTSELQETDMKIPPLLSTAELFEYGKRCRAAMDEVDELVKDLEIVKRRMEQVVESAVLLQDVWKCAQMQKAEEEEEERKRRKL